MYNSLGNTFAIEVGQEIDQMAESTLADSRGLTSRILVIEYLTSPVGGEARSVRSSVKPPDP